MSASDPSWVMVEIDRNGERSIHCARLLVKQETRECWAVLTDDNLHNDPTLSPEYQLDPLLLEEQPDTLHGEPVFHYPHTLQSPGLSSLAL